MAEMTPEKNAWWNDLRHQGSLISAAVLDEVFRDLQAPSTKAFDNLAADYNSFETWLKIKNRSSISNDPLHRWCDAVLENFLGYKPDQFLKTNKIPNELTVQSISGEKLKPQRILMSAADSSKPLLAVIVEPPVRTDEGYRPIGIGRGRTTYGKLLEYLRGSKIRLGLLTNGIQFRLCYAGLDNDAWAEWDVRAWFEERESRRQLSGFLTVLGGNGTIARDGYEYPLLRAVEDSRSKQAELATVMGQQVRAAVELLIDCLNVAKVRHPDLLEKVYRDPNGSVCPDRQVRDAIYQSATRLVMRLVVALYAEARGLLSRSQHVYEQSYGVEGLYELLKQTVQNEGQGSLEERHYAWTRLLALFKVLHDGFSHPDLNIPAYGGLLFRTGDPQSPDIVLRALAVFENDRVQVSDDKVFAVLRHLKIGRVKIKQGRGNTMVPGIVNFSDLKTEFIGIMYEGLLDFELRSADRPLVILNLGQEPILPLNLLESKTDKELKELIGKLGKEKAQKLSVSEDEPEDEESEDSDESESPEQEETDAELENADTLIDENDRRRYKAVAWAKRAVVAAGLVKRGKKEDEYYFNQRLDKAAENLIIEVFDKDEFYLARWGGTRKGSGTFYTKPGLAIPTARRTLQPLLYDQVDGQDIPKTPEQILALKICDPSCGSASFLVAALNYITDALYESLVYHRNIADLQNTKVLTLPLGTPSTGSSSEEVLPLRPDDERFEERIRSRLRRYVVERCIYGVDLNAMAVELARLSLWIETMDPELPFGFLDHKIKVGNSLVGCWFDRFQDYPLAAWLREGGSKDDTERIKDCLKGERNDGSKRSGEGIILKEMKEIILSRAGVMAFGFQDQKVAPEGVHDQALAILQKIHDTSVAQPGIREKIYREEFLANELYRRLKEAFDAWCALWFWPSDRLSDALPRPSEFYKPGTATKQIVQDLAGQYRFFHWELEFPDVFATQNSGFDAILGNPPWETLQPMSKEFFSNYDPLYRTYGKQEALEVQKRLFATDPEIEREWLNYIAYFKAHGNWTENAAAPYGDPKSSGGSISFSRQRADNESLHSSWRLRRERQSGYADPQHPFRYQGTGKAYTYKMFLDLSYGLLKDAGRLGVIVPSGIYTDNGTRDLRELYVENSDWEWLFGFENRRKIFDIDERFKFCPIIVQKGGQTDAIKTAFMRHDLRDWEDKAEDLATPYEKSRITIFSPKSKALLELRSKRDIEIVEKIYANSVLLGDQSEDGWKIKYQQGDFNMTSDSRLFKPRPWWEERGYKPDLYGRWIGPDGDIALPVYEGRMVGQYDFSEKGWVSGHGRSAVWRTIDYSEKVFAPQFLMSGTSYEEWDKSTRSFKLAFIGVTSATNTRSMISTLVPDMPVSNVTPLFHMPRNLDAHLVLLAILNSFVYDFCQRSRLGAGVMYLNPVLLVENPLPPMHPLIKTEGIGILSARLALAHPLFSPHWLILDSCLRMRSDTSLSGIWALSNHERLRLKASLDASIAQAYGLDENDLEHILKADRENLKGFWRVDKDKPPELRQTTLALLAFKRLKEIGVEQFLAEDWQFPKDIADRLGPRYLDWQKPNATEEEIKQSWDECEMHARNILGEEGFKRFMLELKQGRNEDAAPTKAQAQAGEQGKLI